MQENLESSSFMSEHDPATVTLLFSRSSWAAGPVHRDTAASARVRVVSSAAFSGKLAPPRRGHPLRSHRGGGRAHNGVRLRVGRSFKFKSFQVRAIRLGVFEAASSPLGAGYPQGSLSRVPFATWQRLLSRSAKLLPVDSPVEVSEATRGVVVAPGHPAQPLLGCSKRHSHSAFGTKLQSLKRRDLC